MIARPAPTSGQASNAIGALKHTHQEAAEKRKACNPNRQTKQAE